MMTARSARLSSAPEYCCASNAGTLLRNAYQQAANDVRRQRARHDCFDCAEIAAQAKCHHQFHLDITRAANTGRPEINTSFARECQLSIAAASNGGHSLFVSAQPCAGRRLIDARSKLKHDGRRRSFR